MYTIRVRVVLYVNRLKIAYRLYNITGMNNFEKKKYFGEIPKKKKKIYR